MPPEAAIGVRNGVRGRRAKPGPKGPHSGQFKGGPDPRRHVTGPRSPTIKKTFQQAIGAHVEDAVQVLADCINDTKASYKERQCAAELVLAHAVGSPVNRVMLNQVGTGGTTSGSVDINQLRHQAAELLGVGTEIGTDVVDTQ